MEADDGALGKSADLHQIAELVRHPQSSPGETGLFGTKAACQGVSETPLVTYLAYKGRILSPQRKLPSASMLEAVGDHFMSGEGEIPCLGLMQAEFLAT